MAATTIAVQAIARGYYGVPGSATGKEKNKTGVAGGTEIVRNPGEVFDMDVSALVPAETPNATRLPNALGREREKVKVGAKEYVLPTWVVSVKNAETPVTADSMVPKGHKTEHRADTVI